MYVGHKVTMLGRKDALTGEETPGEDGMVIDVNRDQYGNLNSLYVLIIDADHRGYVHMAPLHQLVFHNGAKLLKDVKSPYDQMVSQTLGMMLKGLPPMEV